MKKVVYRFGIRGLAAGLLTVNALCASAQGDGDARQNFKDICFRSFLGINDEVLADVNRFPCDQKWIPPIELGERFGDFTNATMTVMKNGDTGKLRLAGVKFVKSFGNETDDRALLREYEHAVDLVSNLLGVKVECSGLVDPVADVGYRPDRHIGGRITSRTILELARDQLVEILATEASYVIRSGKPIQTAAALVEIRFACSPFRSPRPSGQGSESVRELTLGNDCSDLFSLKLRVKKEEAKLQELKMQNLKECINRQGGNEREPQRQQLEQIQEELRKAREARQAAGTAEAAKSANSDEGAKNTVKNEKVSVAEKLGTCDFLLNKDFKKNAKYYLCLFSASWCGPCRAEMPRIAKIYAETLRDDPDIELIHFSRDQNDERALAWAKQNDVKFPVVKPKGGNPLDLRCNGIPHMFILKSDGTLVEEDHPMRIFIEEKFRELKCGGSTDGVKSQNDKGRTLAIEGVENVTTEGGLFTLTGPYGIRMTADPGCEKGAEYIMKRLVEHYLPQAKEFYGDPFLGEKPSRTYKIDVDRNDGLGNSQYTGPSYRPGTGSWSIGLSKGADRYEMELDYLASSVLTLCEEPKWASFVFYVNRFVEAKAKGIDAAPRLKEDIRRGLEDDDEGGKDNWYRSHAPLWAALEDLRAKHPTLILDYCVLKNKRFAEGKLPKKLSLEQMAVLLREVSGENASELFSKYGVKDSNTRRSATGRNPPVIAKSKDGKDGFKGEKSTATVDGITWSCSIQGGEATIESPTGKLYERAVVPQPVGVISIPSAVNGTPVTGIGKFALCNCPELVSVKIPNTVKSIGEWAFYGCESLAEVWIPQSVTEIGECVFANCPRLASIIVAADNPKYKVVDGVLYTKDMKCLVAGHGGLTSVMIPEGVTDINVGAFRCCRKLKSVTIPEGVRRIGKDAFCGASALESICIPSSVERIENATFWGCGKMTTLALSEGVTSIGYRAFLSCRGLESLTIPASVKRIDPYAFEECSGLASVTMCGERPDAKDRVFSKCGKLKEIHVPANAKSWAGMKKWQGIPLVFDGGVSVVKSDDSSVTDVVANKPVAEKVSVAEKLGTCDFLLNKDFKKNAKYYLCLFSASWCPPCRREMPRIAKTYVDTLKDDPDIELIHFSRDQDDDKALAWAKEHDVKFPVVKPNGGNPLDLRCSGIPHLFILKADGTLVEHDHPMRIFNEEKFRELKSGNVKVKPRTADVELKNGERTEKVDGYTWTYRVENGCATIVAAGGLGRCTISPVPHGDVVIPAKLGDMSVTSIGDFAFWECGQLTSVTIPSSVKSICAGAFWNCRGMTSVKMLGERPAVGSQMFAYCGKLKEIHVPADAKSWAGMKEWQGIPLVFN